MSKLLEPIAVQRPKHDFLEKIQVGSWVTIDPFSNSLDGRYVLKEENQVKTPKTDGKSAGTPSGKLPREKITPMDGPLEEEEKAMRYEFENMKLLQILRRHTNRSKAESSGPTLRHAKSVTGEVAETYPN